MADLIEAYRDLSVLLAAPLLRLVGEGREWCVKRLSCDGVYRCVVRFFHRGGQFGVFRCPFDDEDKFAAWFGGLKVVEHFGQRAADALFVEFGNLTAGRAAAVRSEDFGHLLKRFDHTMGTFVENHRTRFGAKGFEARQSALLLRQKPLEAEAFAGQSARHESRNESGGTGQALHLDATRHSSTDKHESGVGDGGRAGIADEGHRFAGSETCGKGFGRLVLIELMVAHQARRDVVVLEKLSARPGVFGQYDIDLSEDAERTEGDVFQIADGRGDEVEHGVEIEGEKGVVVVSVPPDYICKSKPFFLLQQIKLTKFM